MEMVELEGNDPAAPGRISPLAPGITLAATPIGNLADASFRLVAALQEADLIAAEDTRRLRQLAAGLRVSITARVVACHDHNEQYRATELCEAALAGSRVLVVSDAGMPTISDPGFRLTQRAVAAGIPVTVIPGPSAPVTALAVSGLAPDAFVFAGFLARKGRERTAALRWIGTEVRTVILFESPHRLAATLQDLVQVCGAERLAAVARELTKLHEEIKRGALGELVEWASGGVRGEIVIVLAGVGIGSDWASGAELPGVDSAGPGQRSGSGIAVGPDRGTSSDSDLERRQLDPALVSEVRQLAELGLRLKVAAQHVAGRTGLKARELYNAAIASD